tara:strand:+ start:1341 stop:2060 length:720 start_codon:yes stop_codon:yes gene_type:complete
MFKKIKEYLIFKIKRFYHEQFIFKFFEQEEIFSKIYKNNYWGSNISKSGPGSDYNNTIKIRKELPKIIKKFKIKSILDAPCGDFFWMNKVLKNLKIQYVGADIVSDLILLNKIKFANKNIKFMKLDLTKSKLPKSNLWICRALFFHLDFKSIKKILHNLKRSEIKYILITNSYTKKNFKNKNIINGDYRPLDLFKAPFNFDKNFIYKFNDTFFPKSNKVDQEMVLWNKTDLIKNLKNFL